MPFLDLNSRPPPDEPFEFTVVGAGAAGILLAVELARRGRKVLLLESGHFDLDDARQALNEVEQRGKPLESATWGRKRAIGGTTLAWGGQALPFRPADFERKAWVERSGWPIGSADLSTYYQRASRFMGIDEFDYHAGILKRLRLKNPGFDPGLFDFHVSKWAQEPNFALRHGSVLQRHVQLLYNAQLLAIDLNSSGTVEGIHVSSFAGVRYRVRTGTLIVAAGGLESVRILLCNERTNAGRFGNHSGWLGKGFMEHPCLQIGTVEPASHFRLQAQFNTHVYRRKKYSLRMSLAEECMRRHRILNCSASLLFLPAPGEPDPYEEIKRLRRDFSLRGLTRVARTAPALCKTVWAYCWNGFFYKDRFVPNLTLMVEQEPTADSHITLGETRDRFGQRQAQIHWSIAHSSWKTVVVAAETLRSEFSRLRLGELRLFPTIVPENLGWLDLLSNVNHHMGGARMSAVPEQGVVDSNLKVWGAANLYVCSSAVFPTGSHSNPTLTLLALSERLVDHLCAETRRPR
jgi:choline dehydrogenase-like flavoprotein